MMSENVSLDIRELQLYYFSNIQTNNCDSKTEFKLN